MMGSGSQQDILSGILAIIRSPDMVARNIEALQEKITKAEEATRLARDEQAKAQSLTIESTHKINDLKDAEANFSEQQKAIDEKHNKIDAYKTSLDDQATDLMKREDTHKTKTKELEQREHRLNAGQLALGKRGNAIENAHNERMAKLDAVENALVERETKLLNAENSLKEKLENLKKLAG